MSVNNDISVRKNKKRLETRKWMVVLFFSVVSMVFSCFFYEWNALLRKSIVLFSACVGTGLAISSSKGKDFIRFVRESRIELRKIIWPTLRETFHTTWIIIIATTIISVILWGLDGILIYLVSFATELRL